MEIRDFIRMLARSWGLVVALVVLAAALGGAASVLQRPTYEATAKAFVTTPSGQSLADLSAGAGFLQTALSGYADLATTAYVLRPVIRQEGLDTTPALLAQRVSVTAANQANLLEVTVVDSDAARSARLANAITAQLSQAVVDLNPAGSGTTVGVVKLTAVDPALTPTSSSGPKAAVLVAAGAVAGLVLAILIALARELLDTRVRTREDLERLTETPLLGSTARNPRGRDHPLILQDDEHSPQAEHYRTIRTNLRFAQVDATARSIVVTSADEREGKSTAAANLALAIARLGERVLLVDADLRRPTLATVFGIDGSVGLSDVVIGGVDLEKAVQQVGDGGLDLLPAGAMPPNPNELLQSASMDGLLTRLHDEYDLIIIDSPPLLAVSDAAVLSGRTGGALLVAAAGRSRRGRIRQALDALDRADARIFGMVLTMVPGRTGPGYGYGLQTARAPKQKPARAAGGLNGFERRRSA